MEYSVKDLAEQIGVSKQAITDKIKKLGLQSDLTRQGNRFVINENQATLIKSAFQGKGQAQTTSNFTKQNDDLLYELVKTLQQQLAEKDNQLAEKDRQIAQKDKQILELTATVKANAQSTNAANYNELAETLTKALPEQTEKKQGFWARVFGKEQ